jgi:hypothetical protein
MDLIILLAIVAISSIVLGSAIWTKNFAIFMIAGSFFIFIGLMILSGGIEYTSGKTMNSWNTLETINGSNVTVTHTEETNVKNEITSLWSNGFFLLFLLFGLIVVFIGATTSGIGGK